jgi:diguanylate cyclase (GGDEF)-like protein
MMLNRHIDLSREASGLNFFSMVLIALWTVMVAVSLWWNLAQQQRETLKIAFTAARVLHKEGLLYRRWASENGGVYITLSSKNPSTPNLSSLSQREGDGTSSEPHFTLVNPAYIMRQLYKLAKEVGETQERITSLRPLRPENAPDAWEKKALKALEQGKTEFSSIEMVAGQSYLRVMHPIVTESSCLGCHEEKGHRVGDIRGGSSIAVPMAPLWQAARPFSVVLWWGHSFLWLLGLGGIILGCNRLRVDQERIITLMFTDPLTGVANRRIFLESLDGAISFAQRHQAPLSIIMSDLDDFKSVNDSFGHDTGDRLLQAFAIFLVENSRQEDLIARWGGEEFIMMLPGTSAKEATVFGERLRHRLEAITFHDSSISLTASFGVSAYQPGETSTKFIERADQALYEAKRLGKNQVIFLEDEDKQIEEKKQKLLHFVSLLAR